MGGIPQLRGPPERFASGLGPARKQRANVINVSDGAVTDGDQAPVATAVRQMASQDGNVLLLNVHISDSAETPVLFPDDERLLPDDYARALFPGSEPCRKGERILRLQPSRRDCGNLFVASLPSSELPGYYQASLRDGEEVQTPRRDNKRVLPRRADGDGPAIHRWENRASRGGPEPSLLPPPIKNVHTVSRRP